MPIDAEPSPRFCTEAPRRVPLPNKWTPLPRTIREADATLVDVLRGRRSAVGGPVSSDDLSSLLWHATALRERRADGRFGIPWESRPAPSAGGLHSIRIVVLPLEDTAQAGEYLPDHHALAAIDPNAVDVNRASVAEVIGATTGTTLQLACDLDLLAACYDNSETLMWRDAGVLAATIAFAATALGLTSVVLGRTGGRVLAAAGIDPRLAAVGGVHVGTAVASGYAGADQLDGSPDPPEVASH
jgi:uncharacterized ferredoxin-like protein